MIDIVITLTFSIVMLLFMAYPAMVISSKVAVKFNFTAKSQTNLTIALAIVLSLFIGLFLKLS